MIQQQFGLNCPAAFPSRNWRMTVSGIKEKTILPVGIKYLVWAPMISQSITDIITHTILSPLVFTFLSVRPSVHPSVCLYVCSHTVSHTYCRRNLKFSYLESICVWLHDPKTHFRKTKKILWGLYFIL